MLIGLGIRDVVLIERLDLALGPGLTALTGETGAGKSIILDALGLATGARAEAGLVRRGAAQAVATAVFAIAPDHPAWAYLEDKGLDGAPGEDLVLRRQLSADGRSRAFVNDQAASVGVLRDLGALLLEVHGQHETVGLLDPRTHRPLLDGYAGAEAELRAVAEAWRAVAEARERADALALRQARAAEAVEDLTARLAELDRLDPAPGEEAELASRRALLGASEKVLADIAAAREALGADGLGPRIGQAIRAIGRARDRALQAGAGADVPAARRLSEASDALDRALVEAEEGLAALDAAADGFAFEPDELDAAETRLFALRAAARKFGVPVDGLAEHRLGVARDLAALEDVGAEHAAATRAVADAERAYVEAAARLSALRRAAGERLAAAVEGELAPLRLEKARFRVAVEPLPAERTGAQGADRVEFEIATNPGAPFGTLGAIASGGELARFALALKAALAARGGGAGQGPVMIFDEVDQGVGGAVADAVGVRLKRLAERAQVLVVTHSPQVAARADAHWRVSKQARGEAVATAVAVLSPAEREDEIARMLSGATVTEAARAAARALIG